jgi:hypothetical protein
MSNDQFLPWSAFDLFGSLLSLLLHRIIAQFFPQLSAYVYHSTLKAQQPPLEGDGVVVVYAMDTALIDAEFEKPGSIFWIYHRQPMAVIARFIGSILISFSIVTWIMDVDKLTCESTLAVPRDWASLFTPTRPGRFHARDLKSDGRKT